MQTDAKPGGAQGIGLAVVEQLYRIGSRVVFGDLSVAQGQAAAARLVEDATTGLVATTFIELDVSNYESVLSVFQTTLDLHGAVDCVIHGAAITERPGWFGAGISMASVAKVGKTPRKHAISSQWLIKARISVLRPISSRSTSLERSTSVTLRPPQCNTIAAAE